MEQIPFDVVMMEIFVRLPMKSICRFRSVCKKWYEDLSSYEFLQRHTNRVSSRVDELLEQGMFPDPFDV
ncbi:putative F-box domain-containing protein [Helianthus anomalus]